MMNYIDNGMSFVIAVIFFVFSLGLVGVFVSSRNIIGILLSIELMILSVVMNFIIFASFLNDPSGVIFVLFILTAAASESAVALAIVVHYFKEKNNIELEDATSIGDKP